jgi:hypothetical protein
MSFEINGKLIKKFDVESKSATFQARDFVIETIDDRYPQMIKFQLTQDRCSVIDPFNEGDQLKVYFDLRGREWNEKYFTNLNAWKIENAGASANPAVPAPPTADSLPTEDPFANVSNDNSSDDMGDLPF